MALQQHVLIVGTVWPEPNSSAAGSRMMQLLQVFKSRHWQITFASAASDSEFAYDISSIGITKVSIKINDSSFDELVKALNPQVVLFDRFITEEQFGWRVAQACPDALRVLDTEDLHCLRYARQNALKENRPLQTSDFFSDYAKREIASIYRCDLSLIISTYEMHLLKNTFHVDESLLYYIPFLLDTLAEQQISTWPTFEQRTNFVSIGNFLHEPNWDSVQWLKNDLWPKIKKQIPQAEMHVYGAYPAEKHLQLNNKNEGFLMKGRAEDVKTVMLRARVCLAPLRFGAGLKGKLIDAMLAGTPSVTTAVGAEAMHDGLPWCGVIADEATDFVNAAVELYSNKDKWLKAQQNGVIIINTIYVREKREHDFIEKIMNTIVHLKNHRLNNFTGAMLMHHTLQSTKYMSKWIELKNKAE